MPLSMQKQTAPIPRKNCGGDLRLPPHVRLLACWLARWAEDRVCMGMGNCRAPRLALPDGGWTSGVPLLSDDLDAMGSCAAG